MLTTTVGGGTPAPITHDQFGQMTAFLGMHNALWDAAGRLRRTQVLPSGTAERTWYVYDAGGQRVRKQRQTWDAIAEQWVVAAQTDYVAGLDVGRAFVGGTLDDEVETLHVSDGSAGSGGTGRLLLVETRTVHEGDPVPSPTSQFRTQLDNHLGSATLELTPTGDVLSYEEFHPWGTTAYRSGADEHVSTKRYRYSGKERDAETGLYYYGARYLAPWLGRWISTDPAGFVDGPNVYAFVRGRPSTGWDKAGMNELECGRGEGQVDSCGNQITGPFVASPENSVIVDNQHHPLQDIWRYATPSDQRSFWGLLPFRRSGSTITESTARGFVEAEVRSRRTTHATAEEAQHAEVVGVTTGAALEQQRVIRNIQVSTSQAQNGIFGLALEVAQGPASVASEVADAALSAVTVLRTAAVARRAEDVAQPGELISSARPGFLRLLSTRSEQMQVRERALEIASTWTDAGTGAPMRASEALGIARAERALGRAASRSDEAGVDFLVGTVPYSLKGAFLTNQLLPIPRHPLSTIDNVVNGIARNPSTTNVVVDLTGLDSAAHSLMVQTLANRFPRHNILILHP